MYSCLPMQQPFHHAVMVLAAEAQVVVIEQYFLQVVKQFDFALLVLGFRLFTFSARICAVFKACCASIIASVSPPS